VGIGKRGGPHEAEIAVNSGAFLALKTGLRIMEGNDYRFKIKVLGGGSCNALKASTFPRTRKIIS